MHLRSGSPRAIALLLFFLANLAAIVAQTVAAADQTAGKGGYSLFNPTPTALLRELNTDRPDKTESPYTVDAGHYQLEMDLLSYTRDAGVENFAIAPINLKAGLLNNLDLQIILETYNVQRTEDGGAQTGETKAGFGDLIVRLKQNFWGNDGGRTAFGVMPFVKVSTNQHGLGNSSVEGGIIFPIAIELPAKFDLGAMTEVDFSRNEENSSYHEEFINSITVSHAIFGELAGYIEFFSAVSNESEAGWVGTFDFGFTYQVTVNVQVDAGLNTGVTRSADNLNPFLGLSVRY